MNKQTKTLQGLLRSLAVIPLLALLIISCGKEKDEAVLIDHSIDMTTNLPEGTDHVYGYSFDPYTPQGITEYNGVSYKYEMQDDYSVKLFTMDGREINQELNNLHGMATWDAEREIKNLLNNADKTSEQIRGGRLKIVTSDLYRDEKTKNLTAGKTVELSLEQLKKLNTSSLNVMKFMSGDTLNFYVSKTISFESKNKNNTVYIDNNSPSGTVLIDGTAYSYTNDNSGIKIYDKEGNEINYYSKGWDIRERLVVPTEEELNGLSKILHGIDKGDKIFVDGKQITKAAYEKIKHRTADSMSIKTIHGNKHIYLYGVSDTKTTSTTGKKPMSKPLDTTVWIKDFTSSYELVKETPETKYQIIKTTQENLERERKNPIAATLIRAMKLKHGDNAAYYLENLEVLESTVLLAASDNLKLGFKIGTDKNGRPSLFAAQGLPYKIEDLQEDYSKLTQGLTTETPTMVYYETPVNTTKKQPESGYGVPLDSINFKSK